MSYSKTGSPFKAGDDKEYNFSQLQLRP